jgi:hypothetical protein
VPDDLLGKKVSCSHCAVIFWVFEAQAPLAPMQVVPSRRWRRPWLMVGVCAVPLVVAALVLAFVWSRPRQPRQPSELELSQILADPAPWLDQTVLVRAPVFRDPRDYGVDVAGRRLFSIQLSKNVHESLVCYFCFTRRSQGGALAGHEAYQQVRDRDTVVVRGRLVRRRYIHPLPNGQLAVSVGADGSYGVWLEDCELVDVQRP